MYSEGGIMVFTWILITQGQQIDCFQSGIKKAFKSMFKQHKELGTDIELFVKHHDKWLKMSDTQYYRSSDDKEDSAINHL